MGTHRHTSGVPWVLDRRKWNIWPLELCIEIFFKAFLKTFFQIPSCAAFPRASCCSGSPLLLGPTVGKSLDTKSATGKFPARAMSLRAWGAPSSPSSSKVSRTCPPWGAWLCLGGSGTGFCGVLSSLGSLAVFRGSGTGFCGVPVGSCPPQGCLDVFREVRDRILLSFCLEDKQKQLPKELWGCVGCRWWLELVT